MPEIESNLDNGKNLWSNLLQEVKEKSSKTNKLPISLLVLGNEGSGKSSLIARLQKTDVKHGVGLEFDYIDIKDDSTDESKKLNIWISSGDIYHTNLLKYALNENNFGFSCCMIVVSLSEPWNILDSLDEWLRSLKMHIDRLKINQHDLKIYQDTLTRQFQEYCEPDLENEKQIVAKRRDNDFNYLHPNVFDDPDKVLVPLEDGVFENNLGLPIIIVVTKTDSIFTLEQNFDYNDDKFDFIQMHLRKICLKYGAALCYTSLKDDRNCDLLLNYILHRCYGLPLVNNASVIEKDAIFIPSGWDNHKKINILSENLTDEIRKQSYCTLINKPLSLVRASAQNRLTEPEIAEDEQVFLMKQQALIKQIKEMGTSDGNLKDVSRGASSTSNRGRKVTFSKNNTLQNGAGLTISGNASNSGAQPANEGVLANFFSSLLNKRGVATGSPLPNQQLVSGDLTRCDSATSELDDSLKDECISISNTNVDTIQTELTEKNEIINQGNISTMSSDNKLELISNNVEKIQEINFVSDSNFATNADDANKDEIKEINYLNEKIEVYDPDNLTKRNFESFDSQFIDLEIDVNKNFELSLENDTNKNTNIMLKEVSNYNCDLKTHFENVHEDEMKNAKDIRCNEDDLNNQHDTSKSVMIEIDEICNKNDMYILENIEMSKENELFTNSGTNDQEDNPILNLENQFDKVALETNEFSIIEDKTICKTIENIESLCTINEKVENDFKVHEVNLDNISTENTKNEINEEMINIPLAKIDKICSNINEDVDITNLEESTITNIINTERILNEDLNRKVFDEKSESIISATDPKVDIENLVVEHLDETSFLKDSVKITDYDVDSDSINAQDNNTNINENLSSNLSNENIESIENLIDRDEASAIDEFKINDDH